MDCQTFDAIEWVLVVNGTQGSNVSLILGPLLGGRTVVLGPAELQDNSKVLAPSRLDLVQDGYFFGRWASAVNRPMMR